MSAQTRFRTLVQHIGRIYSAKEEGGSRTELLQSGLNEIMTVIGPKDAKGWATVTADSERLLHIWVAKESDTTAQAVSTQLVNLLKELASSEEQSKEAEHPALTVSEVRPDVIQHNAGSFAVEPHLSFPVSSRYALPVYSMPAPLPAPLPTLIPAFIPASKTSESKEEFKEIKLTVNEEEVEEEVVEEEVVEEETVEEEVVEEEAVEEEVEEEVVEPEEEVVEEEEEEGMEVEKYFHRGRSYWRDTNSDKLYAVIDGDEVGDEVGALIGGKPQFLAA
jgi:hypothetical protein